MGSRPSPLLLLAILCLACPAPAQNRRELQRVDAIAVPMVAAGPIMGALKCGYDGSIYLRVLVDQKGLLLNPVVRISSDGKQAIWFSLNGVSGLEKGGILDFAPGAHGDVYLLATDGAGSESFYLLTFDEHGAFVSKTKLQSGIRPNQMAVFSSGEFLISGRERRDIGGVSTADRAFTGIFDPHGQLLKRVELPGDIEPKTTSLSIDAARTAERDYSRALAFSTAESSNDGRIYLMRFGADYAPIFSITAAGEARPVKFKLPAGTYLSSIKVDGNKLIAMSVRKQDPKKARIDEVILSIWNLDTGEELEEFYHTSPALGVALACCRPGLFTFVRASDDGEHLALVQASAK